jgi:ATP dependent DNA ligase C terminal region
MVFCRNDIGPTLKDIFVVFLSMSTRNGRLRYFGHSGTGFSEKGLKETIDRLKPLFIDESPVENPPKIPEEIQWVQPRLVHQVSDWGSGAAGYFGWMREAKRENTRCGL